MNEKDKLQKIIHKYIKERDCQDKFICIICSRTKKPHEFQAAHFYSAGSYPLLRFNEFNINGACRTCNYYDEFQFSKYEVNLKEKYGKELVDELHRLAEESKQVIVKWTSEDLEEIRNYYKNKKIKRFIF